MNTYIVVIDDLNEQVSEVLANGYYIAGEGSVNFFVRDENDEINYVGAFAKGCWCRVELATK